MHNIASDSIVSVEKISNDMDFIGEIRRFSEEIADKFESKVTELIKYASILENHLDLVDEIQRPIMFSQLSYGYRRASEAVSWALLLRSNASKNLRRAKAVAYHENFNDFYAKKKEEGISVKDTDASRNMYLEMDSDVIKAKEEEAIAIAILEQFSSLKFKFIQGTSSLKAMYYGNKDSNTLNSAASVINYGDQ